MPAIPFHDSAVSDGTWDEDVQQTQLDNIKEPVSDAVAQGMWAWYDARLPDTTGVGTYPDAKDAYRFPHHEVAGDGTPGAASLSACRNILSTLDAEPIAMSDMEGVRTHLQHHLDTQKPNGGDPDVDESTDTSSTDAGASAESLEEIVAEAPVEVGDDLEEDLGGVEARGVEQPQERPESLQGRAWAIVPEVFAELASTGLTTERFSAQRFDGEDLIAAARPKASMQAASRGGQLAVIPLHGTITPRGSLLASLFGIPSGLEAFRAAFEEALGDDNVSAIVLDVDSPGGTIDLVPETAAQILAARGTKPIVAVANTMMASAAYWIASAADEIVATPSGQVGSIGVFTTHQDISRATQAMGVKMTVVSAGRFKTEGNPFEPLSKQALAAMQSNVNDLYDRFTSDVAQARGVSMAAVQAGYGEGRIEFAAKALTLGMVDRVETFEETVARLGGNAVAADTPDLADEDIDEIVDVIDAETEADSHKAEEAKKPAVDYLTSGLRPAWQIGASRSSVSGRL